MDTQIRSIYQHLYNIPVADMNTAWGMNNGSYSLINAGGGSHVFSQIL